VTVESYEHEEESIEDPFFEEADGECDLFDPFCGLDWWPW
jgi:hypothetical protein